MKRKICGALLFAAALCFAVVLNAATKRPVWAPSVMVTTAEPNATQAALGILARGGNAVDAAAAAAFALGVTEGYSSGIGGGCFVLIRLANGESYAIDGREIAPKKSTRDMFVPKNAGDRDDLSLYSVLAAGTPGEVAALDLAVKDFGRLTLADVLEPAIALADTGFVLGVAYEGALEKYADILSKDATSRGIYFKDDGTPLSREDRIVQKDLARTLTRLKEKGASEFYIGETAALITSCMKEQGGVLQASDLREYSPVVREPVRGEYKGYEVLSMPPPSSGGVHLIQMLNLLEPLPLTFLEAGSSESYHLIAEAMCLAFADRAEYLGDPAFADVPTDGLVSKTYADSLRKKLSRLSHIKNATAGNPRDFEPEHHTTHLCVVDAEGNAVSLTATINTPFGTGITVPGAGILMNNEMDDFVTNPGKPNFFGLVGKPVNEVAAGKKPLSSMTPTIVVKDDKPYLLAGGAGGPKIITATLLSILNVLEFNMNIQQAVDFPRIHQQWTPDRLLCEREIATDVREALRAKGHTVELGPYGSYVQAIVADTLKGGWWGAADGRSNGQARGF